MNKIVGELKESSTLGEKKIFHYFEALLEQEKDLFIYFEPIITGPQPDFIVFSKKYGIIIIEVKDYKEEKLIEVSSSDRWRKFEEKEETIENPISQIDKYWKDFTNRLRLNVKELNVNGLFKPLIIFTNISHSNNVGLKIKKLETSFIKMIFKEEVTTTEKFIDSLVKNINPPLNLPNNALSLIKVNLIPQSRLPHQNQKRLSEFLTAEDDLRQLDLNQEKIAVELGEGHRIIVGVAGSGKTVLLIARAKILAKKNPKWRILVICYNRLMRDYLTRLIIPSEFENIEVSNYHRWSNRIISHIDGPYHGHYLDEKKNANNNDQINYFFSQIVPEILTEALKNHQGHLYDAILIDEAQDFEKEYFPPLIKLLNPETKSLLICLDGLQGIYGQKRFYWKDVGIEAPGRTKIMRKSYRVPETIGKFAFSFLTKDLGIKELIANNAEFQEPEEFIRKGGTVKFEEMGSRIKEYTFIVEKLREFEKNKWNSIILTLKNPEKNPKDNLLLEFLTDEKIKWTLLKDWTNVPGAIHIGSIHGSKGLEADAIIIPEIGGLFKNRDNRHLLYVGMTRAKHYLLLTTSKEGEWTGDIRKLMEESKI